MNCQKSVRRNGFFFCCEREFPRSRAVLPEGTSHVSCKKRRMPKTWEEELWKTCDRKIVAVVSKIDVIEYERSQEGKGPGEIAIPNVSPKSHGLEAASFVTLTRFFWEPRAHLSLSPPARSHRYLINSRCAAKRLRFRFQTALCTLKSAMLPPEFVQEHRISG